MTRVDPSRDRVLAGHISEPGRIELVPVEVPRLDSARRGQILFAPRTACLCGSDLPYFDGQEPPYPLAPGMSLHEMVGTVLESTGERFRPGDRVLAVPIGQRGFYERQVIDESRAIPVPDSLDDVDAVLAQPLGTAIFALRKLPNLIDRTVAIVGQGPMGQIFCRVLRNLGARRIIAIDTLASRLERSAPGGATDRIDARREDVVERVREITDGQFADLVIEAVGHRDQALDLCVDLCRQSGQLLYFGVPPTRLDGIEWLRLFKKNIQVQTSVDPDFAVDFPLAMSWIADGRIDLRPLVTHEYPLEGVQEAFETFRDRRDGALKVILRFPG